MFEFVGNVGRPTPVMGNLASKGELDGGGTPRPERFVGVNSDLSILGTLWTSLESTPLFGLLRDLLGSYILSGGGGVHKQPKEQTTENNEKEQKVRSFFVFCVWVVVFFASLDEVGGGGIVWYNKL
jgi:hypothetical protein